MDGELLVLLTWTVPLAWTWRSPDWSSPRAREACEPEARVGSGCSEGSGRETGRERAVEIEGGKEKWMGDVILAR